MSNCTHGLYVSPQMGSTVDSLNQPLNVTWDKTCLTCQEIDIYLYAPNSPLPRIHVWENVALSRGTYSAQLLPRWWNSTQTERLQIIIVPTGDPPFMSTFPAGPVFTATYSPSSSSPPTAADTNVIDSGVTRVDDLATQQTKKSLSGRAAAGVLIPLIFIALGVFAYIKWKRRRENQKRKAWTEKVDKRMSTISTDWKSVSAAGAQAAIRNSIAVASRNSSFSFGAIRPSNEYEDPEPSFSEKRNTIRTGTGVGLRNPNATARNSSTSTRVSRVSFAPDPRVSRVSFADSTSDAASLSRKNVPSRAFHSAYVPPVPALPDGITSIYQEKDSLSPRQTAGPLNLTQDDIKARIAAVASGRSKGSVSGLDEEVLPALSMMRNMESSETADFFPPVVPEPAYSSATVSITAAFPAPPTQTVATPNVVLSPDEMLRAYAERKKSLAEAAKAGRIGAPLRASGVPSVASSAVTSTSGSASTLNNAMSTSSSAASRIETVTSIHAAGMRVAYNNADVDGLSLPAPTVPAAYQAQSSPARATRALSISGKGAKGIEGGKALIGKVKGLGKKRKSLNPFVKSEPQPDALTEEEVDVTTATAVANPGEDYVAALEAEAAETEAQGQLNAADDIVGAYPYDFDQQYYGYYGYGAQGEGEGQAGYGYQAEEGQQGQGQPYGY